MQIFTFTIVLRAFGVGSPPSIEEPETSSGGGFPTREEPVFALLRRTESGGSNVVATGKVLEVSTEGVLLLAL